jgi:hypothetical protein
MLMLKADLAPLLKQAYQCCTDRIAWHILSHAACWFFD